jgi:glycosyltransferase involved in cell wall biosynthesis
LSFWYGECALVGKRFADKYNIKHFCWMWGQDAKKENSYIQKLNLPATELIVFSDFLQNEFERNHGIRPHAVVPPGIDTRQFSNLPKEKDIDLLAAGSLIPLKQYDFFIEIVTEIKKQLPNVKAMLIGNGPEKDKLHYLIKKNGLEENFTITGELSHPEVLQLMQRTKVFLHPSSYEGFGVVCIEALYAGAKVVSFVKPVNKEIRNWYIVNNKEEMKGRALEILLNVSIVYDSVIVYKINDTVKKMMTVFEKVLPIKR